MFKPSLHSPNIYSTGASADGYAVVANIAGNFLGLLVENTSAATIYVQIFDRTTQPVNGSHPIAEIPVIANSQGSLDLGGVNCIPFKNGLVVAASSAQWNYTAANSSMFLTVFWINN